MLIEETRRDRSDDRLLDAYSAAIIHAVEQVGPAVVRVEGRQGGGSGVVFTPDGFILTNSHVVEGADKIMVKLKDGTEYEGAEIKGVDSQSDVAIIKINAKNLTTAKLGDSSKTRVGEFAIAIGAPFELDYSVTFGHVSAKGRRILSDQVMMDQDFIQTDASINPGNSGGPLVDMSGRVVGINTLIYSQSGGNEGIGFAAPSNIVQSVYKQIRANGRVRRGSIGVTAQTITPSLAQGLGLSQPWGVVLADVHPDSPAAAAGLEAGDIVTALDGKTMENGRQFDVNLYRHSVGDSATVTVLRGDQRLILRVPVIAREDDPTRIIDLIKSDRSLVAPLGVLVVAVDGGLAPVLPWLRQANGVLVVARSADASSVVSGLEPGDVILAVNRNPVGTIDSLNKELSRVSSGAALVLQVNRMGSYRYVAIPPE